MSCPSMTAMQIRACMIEGPFETLKRFRQLQATAVNGDLRDKEPDTMAGYLFRSMGHQFHLCSSLPGYPPDDREVENSY